MKEKKELFSWNKGRAAGAIAVTAVLLMVVVFTACTGGMDVPYFFLAVAISLAGGLFAYLDISYGKLLTLVLYLALPVATLVALENYTHVVQDLDPLIVALNLLFFYLLYGLCAFLFGSVRLGFRIAALIPMIFGLVNYFVVGFRGSPIVPWDFLSLGTALSVAGNYEFSLKWKQAFSILAFAWMILLSAKSRVRFQRPFVRLAALLASAALMGGYLAGIQKSSVQSFFGMDTTLFTLNVLYRNNGIAAAFLGNLRFLHIEEPEGYSPSAAEEIAAQYGAEGKAAEPSQEEEPAGTDSGQQETAGSGEGAAASDTAASGAVSAAENAEYPNIIVIMDEAFSDLSVWGEFETSEEVMPFFKSLQQQAVGGEVYVSVKGGNTANTEFEFLTGDTMGFLPAGSIPYQQYISRETPSLASYLKTLGYQTLAIHPYRRSGWDRDEVYGYFGFDEFLDQTSFDNPKRYRGYVSDSAAFDKIIEQFECKGEGERLFAFEVTMQNHGGYSKETPDFDSYLTLPAVSNKTTSVLAAEKYLTLMNETDKALQDLILYFDQQEEPVIVLMFGDHQPSDYITNVIRRICGVPEPETLQEVQQGYRVPFLIWSNDGLEHTRYEGISVNYLGGILLENAGVPLTGYQQFLQGLMDTLPVVNGNVYRDSEGNFYSYGDGAFAELLNAYQVLQYNHLVDQKHRLGYFFGSSY